MGIAQLAKDFAVVKHANQKRWGGEPYIVHPAAVANAVRNNGEDVEAAAWLHDVMEDCEVTWQDLGNAGFPFTVRYLVDLLTRKPGQNYLEYILAIRKSPMAVIIKMEDIKHNLSDSEGTKGKNSLRAKWELALWILENTHATETNSAERPAGYK